MKEYSKIETLLDRDPKTFKVIENRWRLPEFEALQDIAWNFTEKVDGTNIRIGWQAPSLTALDAGLNSVPQIGGRTDAAQIPVFLLTRLNQFATAEAFLTVFGPAENGSKEITLYGEGYGARIQKAGGNYKADGVDFVLFDVQVNGIWLRREDVTEIAAKFAIKRVPESSEAGKGTLHDAIHMAKEGFCSYWGDFQAEGLVVRPAVELADRLGHRIIGKIKHKDFA